MRRIFLLFLVGLIFLPDYAADSKLVSFSFQKLPIMDILPNPTVKRIFQDHNGYIWLGTESGICRYDGYKIITIKSNIEHPNLLTNGSVWSIAEDKQNRIWFGTDRGINIIDSNNKIVHLFTNNKIQDYKINSLLCDSHGNMWIGTNNGLYVYNPVTNRLKGFFHNKKTTSIAGNNINQVFEDRKGVIWVTLWNDGLCRFDSKTETFHKMPRMGKENNPYVIYEDTEGIFWIGTWSDGLFKMDLGDSFKNPHFTQYVHDKNNPNSICENSVFSIIQDNINGDLWLLSHKGLSIVKDKKNVKFEQLNAIDLFGNASNILHQIFKDKQGNLWIGTSNDGVYLAKIKTQQIFSNTFDEIRKKNGYVNLQAIFENGNEMWMSISNVGLSFIDKKNQKIVDNSEIDNLIQRNETSNPTMINCICRDKSDNSIWLGGGTLLRLYQKNNHYYCENIFHKYNLNPLLINNLSALYSDSKKRMWIGTVDGLFLFDKGVITKILSGYSKARTICEEGHNVFWIGSSNKGLLKLKETGNKIFSVKRYNVNSKNINSDEINMIIKDSRNDIWVGTNNGGLNLYDKSKDKFVCQNKKYSILDEDIKGIVEDRDNNLWVSTNNRIIKINLHHNVSKSFSANDNIHVYSFQAGVCAIDSDGRIYFGGGNGYCTFFPDKKQEDSYENRVVITDILVKNQSIFDNDKLNVYNSSKNQLTLNYKQRDIGLEFSALNYSSASNISYAYKLKGVDNDWITVDSKRRYVNYNNLSKGTYTFLVKSTDENGVWSKEPTQLHIVVEPAPYETWWAYSLYVILFAIIAISIYRNVSNRIKLRHDLLISKIEKEKSEELNQAKLRYFTNVSHELLTPLTIITCLIEEYNHNFPNQFKQYSIMKSNVIRLRRLLQQVLDFRKVDSGNMKLHVEEGNIAGFIHNICWNNFEQLAREKNINFTVNSNNEIIAWFDADKIDKIIFNLLSNAFKHTPVNGSIDVLVQLKNTSTRQFVQIFVSDTGSGIDPERLPRIFERFVGNETYQGSNGIGLSLTKELVELHKGTISVESELNKGTTFLVELPVFSEEYTLNSPSVEEGSMATLPENMNDENYTAPSVEWHEKAPEITLLVIEDNTDLLTILENDLSRLYTVKCAENGEKALEIMADNDIDIIVSDVMMPGIDGITLCKMVKGNVNYSHIPVLLLTARNQIADRIESYNAGADAYISKPFEMEVLHARIRSLLLNRQKRNKEYQAALTIPVQGGDYDSIDGLFLQKAVEMVEKNMADFDFSHEQLTEMLNVSKSTFYRKIKSLTGLSPSEFIRDIRLKHACQMLQKQAGNISDISYAVGFNDPKYFSTCFKTEFGVSPREYVRNIQANQHPDNEMPE